MKRRVQLELNAPRVNWPILQSQPLECVLSDGTYPLSLSFSSPNFSLSLSFFRSSTRSHTHTHTHSRLTHSLTQSVSLTQSLDLVTRSFTLSFTESLRCLTLHRLTFTNSSSTPQPLLPPRPPSLFFPSTHVFVLYFFHFLLPSLPHFLSPLISLSPSLIPVEQKSHQAGGRLLFPLCIVCRVIGEQRSVQQQGV